MIIVCTQAAAHATPRLPSCEEISIRKSRHVISQSTYQRSNTAVRGEALGATVGSEVICGCDIAGDCKKESASGTRQKVEEKDVPEEHDRSARPRTSVPQHMGVSRGPQRSEASRLARTALRRFMSGVAAAEAMAAMARMLVKTFMVMI